MPEDRAFAHLEAIKQDMRDEIKRRIQQRDQYSMQLTITLGVLAAVSFSQYGSPKFLIVAPLISIYFTYLILSSYRIHRLIVSYLRKDIEPDLANLCHFPPEKEWEVSYNKQQETGYRRLIFVIQLWVISASSLLYLWVKHRGEDPQFDTTLSWAIGIYFVFSVLTTIREFVPVEDV
jgi:hypothetical protein